MPRYSPHEPPDGFLIAPSSKGFLVLRPRDGIADPPIWEQVGGPFAEHWYAVRKANHMYRRWDIFNTITGRLADMASTQGMSPTEYDRAVVLAREAYLGRDDTALMRYLALYVPDSPRLQEPQAE